MKKQKHDLTRKLKEENDIFIKFKYDKNKDMMIINK